MLPDILFPLFCFFIPISKWYFDDIDIVSLAKHHLFDPTNKSKSSSAFKAYCLGTTSAQAIATTEEDAEKTLLQFWMDYDIQDGIKSLAWVWDDVTRKYINSFW